MAAAGYVRTVLLASVLSGGCGGDDAARAGEPPDPTVVRLETAATSTWIPTSTGTARIRAQRSVELRADISGRVREVSTHVGAEVEPGRVLARIYSARDAAEALAAAAVVAQTRARYEAALGSREINESLATAGATSAASSTLSRSEESVASAQLREAQARHQARRREANAAVVAPFAGTITEWRVEDDQFVEIGSHLGTLADLSAVVADCWLSVAPDDDVVVGSRASLTFSELEPHDIDATVAAVSPVADPTTGRVFIELAVNGDLVRPGTVGVASIQTGAAVERITIPRQAVVERFGQAHVYVVDDNVAHLRSVHLGDERAGRVVVNDGLDIGERYIVDGASRVADGAPVVEATDQPGE